MFDKHCFSNEQVDNPIYMYKIRWSNTRLICILHELDGYISIYHMGYIDSFPLCIQKIGCILKSCDIVVAVGVRCTTEAPSMIYVASKIKIYHEVNQSDA